MAGTTPIYGLPYPQSTDLVADYPALGQDLATDLDNILNTKKLIQVVSNAYATPVSIASTAQTNTGLAGTITPSSASNNILVTVALCARIYAAAPNRIGIVQVKRGATVVYTQSQALLLNAAVGASGYMSVGGVIMLQFVDAPASTAGQTYTVTASIDNTASSGTFEAQPSSGISVITLMELIP